jgi:uncharacterized protein (DUF1684 family)
MKRVMNYVVAAAILAAVVVDTSAQDKGIPSDAEYQHSFDQWKTRLTESRIQTWLTLAGLFWLKPGKNTFGIDPGNSIVFPKGPVRAGTFELGSANDVTLELSSGVNATADGKPITGPILLRPDNASNPSAVKMGSLEFMVLQRDHGVGIRLIDTQNEAAKNYPGLIFFPLDKKYRVLAKWVPAAENEKKTIEVPDALGDIASGPAGGAVVFTIDGHEQRLIDIGGDPSKGLFLVFADLTSATDTYPGGRFLSTRPVVNNTVVLDFNFASNPPCALTPYATCPLAPKENRLTIAIPAGEKYNRVHGHH